MKFKKASEKLAEPCGKSWKSHHDAVEKAVAFIAVMENRAISIDHQLNWERSKRVPENQTKLPTIAAMVIFCGRQGIALRGHPDDGHVVQTETSVNLGNFQALLQVCIDTGDTVLKEHLRLASHNAMYTSIEIQNGIIGVHSDIIWKNVLQRIRNAQFFSVIADEATDVANDEQLSISIHFVQNGLPLLKFLCFHECKSGITDEVIGNDILAQLAIYIWQLEAQFIQGQAYDGAAAIAAKSNGENARRATQYPKAVYTQCAAPIDWISM